MITFVGYITPFKSRLANFMELLNEVFVLVVCYWLFTFTDFLSDAPTREFVGFLLVVSTIGCIVLNFGVVGFAMVTVSFFKLKLKYKQW